MERYSISRYDHDFESKDNSWRYYTSFDVCKELFSSISYSDIKLDKQGDCILIPYSSGSDYSGSTVELSNFNCIKEDFSQYVLELYGGYGSFGLLIKLSDLKSVPELKELFDTLDSYPLYNEDDHSQLESDLLNESWDAWVKYDFDRELKNNNIDPDSIDDLENLFWDSLRLANDDGSAYPIYEDISHPFIRLEELIPYVKTILKGLK